MSQKVLARLKARFGEAILAAESFRGDDEALVAPDNWLAAARYLRDDAECAMNHFIDLTIVDYPEREPATPRFDVLLFVRSLGKNHRVRLKTRVRDGEGVDTLTGLWEGANWTEREAYDMFGVKFLGHPDLRRILMYEEFVGYPLRKDYPIGKTQPLIPYREVAPSKLAPFGADEGQPYGRIDWLARMAGRNLQVSPAIGVQQGQRPALSVDTEDLAQPRKPNGN
ncbi:MAG TPA: NADH-quinone oxidoreductase subunit C [Polyangiales bacterium]|jgi:NADH-quinone oxidoreductase subunit C|nr:NADH-quinone oxidoreductase subunit C [Polyangiales bacterium]